MLQNVPLQKKLIGYLLFFGLIPALLIYSSFLYFSKDIRQDSRESLLVQAQDMIDVIDRNLYERMGDVQSFSLNALSRVPNQWHTPIFTNTINDYMALYGTYDAMLVIDTQGVIQAQNTVDPNKKPIKGQNLVGHSVASEEWFRNALAGQSAKNKDGSPSGTYASGPMRMTIADAINRTQDSYGMVFASVIKDYQGNVIGVWANFCSLAFVEDFLASSYQVNKAGGLGHTDTILINKEGVVLAEYDSDKTPQQNAKRNFSVLTKFNLVKAGVSSATKVVAGQNAIAESYHARKKRAQIDAFAHAKGYLSFPGFGWSVLVRALPKEVDANTDHLDNFMLITIAISGIVFLIAGYFVGKTTAAPFNTLTEIMSRIAAGHKGLEIPYLDNKAEVGYMAQACQRFKQLVVETERLQQEQTAQAEKSQNDLRQQMLLLTDEIEKEMKETITQVMENAETVLQMSNDMSLSSQRVSSQSTAVSQATQRAQSNVESVAAATEELSISVNEISQQVSHAAVTAQSAVASASQTNETVQRLADAVRNVGDVVLLISDIAEQTNLLALNATIEAARAGEAGKGFAVVAAEVKNLANQTTKATDGITGQIAAIQSATENAVSAIEGIMQTIQEIDSISSSIAAAVEEQGVATNEISSNTQQAAEGTRNVSEKIVEVNTEFQHTNELSIKVKDRTDDVMRHICGLRNRMVEILRNSYAGNRRVSPRYKAEGYNVIATYEGKSFTCAVKDISAEGVAFYSKDLGRMVKASDTVGLELSGFPQMITGTVCGVAANEIVRLSLKMDERLHAAITRFVKSRFADAPDAEVA